MSKYLRVNIKGYNYNKRNIVDYYNKNKINSDVINHDNNNIITSSSSSSTATAEAITTAMNCNDIGIGTQVKFPWSQYIVHDESIFYVIYKYIANNFVQDFLFKLQNKNNESIINYNDIAINSMNLFKEATMSIFQHDLVRLHRKQTIGVDSLDKEVTATPNTIDNNISSNCSNNTSSKRDIDNDPFPLTFIFESKLAGLYQHAIERYCMNPNLSIHYQLHEIKSSSIYETEIIFGTCFNCFDYIF